MISIIIPVYNCEMYLEKCLNSIRNQTYKDFEVIVVDDGSNDKSLEILNDFKMLNYFNMKIYSKINEGQAVARNIGVSLSTGDYICFVDADDEVTDDYLLKFKQLTDLNVDLGITQIKRVYEGKNEFIKKRFNYIQNIYFNGVKDIQNNPDLLTKIMNAPYAKIIRKRFLTDNSIVFLEGKRYEDFYFTMTLLVSNPTIAASSQITYLYYVRDNSSMTKKDNKILDMLDVFDSFIDYTKSKKCFYKYYEEIEYLALYHVGIGTAYRLTVSKPLSVLFNMHICHSWLISNNFFNNNKYVIKNHFIIKIYLFFLYMN
ncbi:glycosyltransferase family 2 protein [Anaerorhabdus sp.]|uniref:glycosyltransferase family 2 protein n=1 Tax=Anaerorhabdus sp. TaxID=1872524 RepID=UPI002FCC29DA